MTALIYGRMSTGHQDNSLDIQDQKCRDYCALRGFTLAGTYADPATSGRTPVADRPGGADLLRRLTLAAQSSEPIGHLVVAKLDRLGRNAADLLATVKQLTELGVTVHFVDIGGDSMTTSGPVGRLFLTRLAACAEWEVEMIRERTLQTMTHLRRQGKPTGGTVPYGWQQQDGRWVEHPDEQRTLAQMQAMSRAGLNPNRIMRWLNAEGIPSKTGKQWTYAAVQSALTAKINQPA